MIDIQVFRENPDLIKKSHKKRGIPTKEIDEVIRLDKEWREQQYEVQKLQSKRNKISSEIAELKKSGKDVKSKIKEMQKISDDIKSQEENVKSLLDERDKIRMIVPNILDDSVPAGKDDSENVEISTWGKKPTYNFELKGHEEIAINLGMLDMENAAKISGARFFYLKGDLVLLDMAIQRFAIDHMISRGFTPILPPFMMRKEPYEGATPMADFGEVLYKIEGEDLYLIATSEHPMIARLMNETVNEKDLPICCAGVSPCFRKEAGSHGKDTKGIFRTHQFNKVEQIVFCKPEDSEDWFNKIHENTELIVQKLGLHYRIVKICTGDIGTFASKKHDLEVWMPVQDRYRELGSCSNIKDYQANRLNIKFADKDGKKKAVHTLNNTVLPTGRTIVAILENFQQKDGSVKIPEALWPYMNGIKVLKHVAKQ
jgi:seryl-tRNA synthetase